MFFAEKKEHLISWKKDEYTEKLNFYSFRIKSNISIGLLMLSFSSSLISYNIIFLLGSANWFD